MKPTSKRVIGIILLTLSIVTIPIALCQVVPNMLVDYPCMAQQLDQQGMASDTRIAYCISIWPRVAISGGGIYAGGLSNQDELRVDPLRLRRVDLQLFVNEYPIEINETYSTTRFAPLNPWVVLTSQYEVRNDGLLPGKVESSASVLFISGDVYESWFPSPLGPIMLVSGIWLISRAKKEIARQAAQTEAG